MSPDAALKSQALSRLRHAFSAAAARLGAPRPALAVSVFFAMATLAATTTGMGLTPDSVSYISSGLSLSSGRGLHTFSGMPLTMFPPGLPLLIALGDKLSVDPDWTLRVINAVSGGGTIWLTWKLLRRHVQTRLIAALGLVFAATSVALLDLTKMTLSEGPFVFVALCFLIALQRSSDTSMDLKGSSRSAFLAAVVLSWVAFLLRYSGLAFVPIGAIVVCLSALRRGWPRALLRSVIFTVAASVIPLLVMLRNHSVDGTLMGPRNPSMDTLFGTATRFVAILGKWLVPDPTPQTIQGLVGGLSVLIVFLVALWIARSRASKTNPSRLLETFRPLLALLVFAIVYSAYLVSAQLSVAFDPINSRLMSPLLIPLLVLGTAGVDLVIRHQILGNARAAKTAAFGFVTALLAFHSVAFSLDVFRSGKDGVGYAERAWQRSPVVAAAAATIPPEAVLYSNSPAGLWAVVRHTPTEAAPTKRARRSDIALEIPDDFLDSVACSHAYLVWVNSAAHDYFFTPSELKKYASVTPAEQRDDGTVYRLGPLASSSQRRC